MSCNVKWLEKVNIVKNKHGFRDDYDLAQEFNDLHLITENEEALRDAFRKLSADGDKIRKAIEQIEKLNNLLSDVSETIQETLEIPEIIQSNKEKIQKFTEWSTPSPLRNLKLKKYNSSKPLRYIQRLVGVFYEGTGKLPICKRGQNFEDKYKGNFYDFLMDARPLLLEIGLNMQVDNNTIGKYAFRKVNGGDNIGGLKMPSFEEALKEPPCV